MKKRALIIHLEPVETLDKVTGLNEAKNDYDSAFSILNGCFSYNKARLEKSKFSIDEIQYTELKKKHETFKPNQKSKRLYDFVWIRGHGSFDSVSKSHPITCKDIPKFFNWLPSSLTENATILLDACSTGKIEHETKNLEENLQFTFAKHTQDLKNVDIIAPLTGFLCSVIHVNEDFSISAAHINSDHWNRKEVSVTLSKATKEILETEHTQDALKESLEFNKNTHLTPGPNYFRCDATLNMMSIIHCIIKKTPASEIKQTLARSLESMGTNIPLVPMRSLCTLFDPSTFSLWTEELLNKSIKRDIDVFNCLNEAKLGLSNAQKKELENHIKSYSTDLLASQKSVKSTPKPKSLSFYHEDATNPTAIQNKLRYFNILLENIQHHLPQQPGCSIL